MREIKFRAWHEHNGEFLFCYIKDIWKNGVECVRCGAYSGEYTAKEMHDSEITKDTFIPNADWEQFTGLRDKNGKEIYEGDIVNSSYFMRPGVRVVSWEDGGDDAYVWHGYPFDGCDVEVIGNIHENPELAKAAR